MGNNRKIRMSNNYSCNRNSNNFHIVLFYYLIKKICIVWIKYSIQYNYVIYKKNNSDRQNHYLNSNISKLNNIYFLHLNQ